MPGWPRASALDCFSMPPKRGFDELIATNLKGPHFLTQQAARWMTEAGAGQYRLRHVDFRVHSQCESRRVLHLQGGPSVLTVALYAQRLAELRHIQVFEIRPGVIRTDMIAKVEKAYDEKIAARPASPSAAWARAVTWRRLSGPLPMDCWITPPDRF